MLNEKIEEKTLAFYSSYKLLLKFWSFYLTFNQQRVRLSCVISQLRSFYKTGKKLWRDDERFHAMCLVHYQSFQGTPASLSQSKQKCPNTFERILFYRVLTKGMKTHWISNVPHYPERILEWIPIRLLSVVIKCVYKIWCFFLFELIAWNACAFYNLANKF